MLREIGLDRLLARVWGERQERVAAEVAEVVAWLSCLCAVDTDEAPALVEINPLMIPLDGGCVVAADALVQLADAPGVSRSSANVAVERGGV
jgi:succinyl-CoA synthetase beta subunit